MCQLDRDMKAVFLHENIYRSNMQKSIVFLDARYKRVECTCHKITVKTSLSCKNGNNLRY